MRFFKKYQLLLIFEIISLIELLIVHIQSDLPIGIINWFPKAREIISMQIPSSNFYPAGSAILTAPFLWITNYPLVIVAFYWLIGNIFFYKITSNLIKTANLQKICIAFLLINPYLGWLFYSSQDTVYEYFLLTVSVYALIRNMYVTFLIFGFLLNLTRPAYWLFYLISSFLFFTYFLYKRKTIKLKYLIPLVLLLSNSIYNFNNYHSYKLAEESGVTSYFSYNKYLYLSLPLFDMDVFLSKEGHMSNPYNLGESPDSYAAATLKSIKENPKEILLASMQKIDSYVFSSQKTPKLSGEYFLSADSKSIIIGDQRLNWSLVIGGLIYQAYRGTLFLLFLVTIGLLISLKTLIYQKIPLDKFVLLLLPWFTGLISCVIFYTETRFKIVSELLLQIFIFSVIDLFKDRKILKSKVSF